MEMQQRPPEAEPAPDQGGEDQGQDIGAVVEQTFAGLTQIFEAVKQSGDPKKTQQIAAITKAFQMFASGEADGAEQAPQGGGNVPPEAGANPNVRQAM